MIHNTVLIFLISFQLFVSGITACTGILLRAKDNSIVTGRTVEFGVDIKMSVAVIPRNFQFVGNTPKGKGMAYKAKYATFGIYCFDVKKLMDGMNEKGLVAAAFYFPGYAEYAHITTENQSKALSPVEFPNWILTQFATVEEVKAGLSSVVIAPTILDSWGSTPPPMHYVVYDRHGKSIVIEPINGKLVVSENVVGVITNSPTFDWHLTNLRNYINLTPFNVDPLHLRGLKLAPFGQGSGMRGLPGDFTPPSRFVRAAVFCHRTV
ncbi:choloylglycine hydrolase [Candidatus Aerophobetes bacterium]|uniref:Choloylglycine hydrolase n=1 Tax=Aerophobetes bacterium TaxID=2030807 RepID=A0A2A4YFP6_UNCAE|nr:MAG: choloylglycine hydrolase [Candidatus Aerophobetes bacterium]